MKLIAVSVLALSLTACAGDKALYYATFGPPSTVEGRKQWHKDCLEIVRTGFSNQAVNEQACPEEFNRAHPPIEPVTE